MADPHPISIPAGYAPAFALGYSDAEGDLTLVKRDAPLPVHLRFEADGAPALTGETSATMLAGPFSPQPGLPVMLTLSGSWQGRVQLQRSMDDGATVHGVTVAGQPWGEFSANACEPVWTESEAGAQLFLAVTIDSGTLAYRIAQ
ncbi:hypothetical protein [Paraurantiacibacter namhicola]|uniref:Uncharacterized protein n=1 Tax=Paraurantiacibacter namhicola TaxID=645517 RepID=A0A1C7D6G0_9SPHN|nr:hypothetical protein [Paraurantiacibacter namhicola]ANU06911.1 hypothetical protein A6F65_00589 [Paraurantiacibacter namhicola]